MSESSSAGRPWLAAFLGALLPGTGHLYLRRWKRATLWIVLAYATSLLFVPPEAAEAVASGELPAFQIVLPVAAVTILSALDAYLLAVVGRARSAASSNIATAVEDGGLDCPRCGKEADAELGFCHWCSLQFDQLEVEEGQDGR
jgi:hypothetical protein